MPGFLVPLVPGSSERIELPDGETTLGRKSTCSIAASFVILERFWYVSFESPKKCTNCVLVNFLIWSFRSYFFAFSISSIDQIKIDS